MKFLYYTWLFCLCIAAGQSLAQKNVPFEKEFFKDRKDEFKEAVRNLEKGDELLEIDQAYDKALEFYLKAYDVNPNNAELCYKIGKCYIYSIEEDGKDAIPFLEKAFQLNRNADPNLRYYLARAYHLNHEWEKAVTAYKAFRTKGEGEKRYLDMVPKHVEECKVGQDLEQRPVRIFLDNLGAVVNSKYSDFGPVINADETIMMFTSRREDTTGGEIDENDFRYFEDIYYTTRIGNAWSMPKNIGKPINSDVHDATVGLSPDGTRLLIFREGDLYECDLKGSEWTKPEKLPKTINTKDRENSACFSYDGKSLYFVSDRQDMTLGGLDIFRSDLGADGQWGPPVNLGPSINTPYDEEGVFMHPDGKTMYFSSRGHKTMGGYDIFKSVWENGRWSVPENLGMPINSPGDDVFFVLNGNGRRGYYASAQKGGQGEKDLYLVTFLGPEKPMLLNTEDNLIASVAEPVRDRVIEPKISLETSQLTIFKGVTLDSITRKPVPSLLTITDNSVNKVVAEIPANSETGRFLLTLPSGRNYGIAVTAPNYLFHSENFDIPAGGNYQEINKEVLLKKIEVGNKIILRNIFFDFDKFALRNESIPELEKVLKLLKDNPNLRVELSGHTDNKGTAVYNKTLSENRSKAVVDWLTAKGISPKRLEYKGYGFDQPIADNKTDEGRQLNRRTEFKILSN